MTDARIAIVIVTHQTRSEVLGCLASIGVAGADEIVVVDAGSTDGSALAVRRARPDVRVLELANAGFGRGSNAGVRVTTAPVVLLCNPDVRFDAGSVRRLADELHSQPELAAVGPLVRYPDGSPQASARRLPDAPTLLGHAVLSRVAPGNRWTRRYRALDEDPGVARDVDWLSGCALAVRREAFEAVGGFDPGFHLYVEDVDLAVRLRAAGWRLRYQPEATVQHRVGAATSQRRWWSLVTHARSLDRFHGRHHRGGLGRAIRPLLRLGLGGWVVATWAWEVVMGRDRHSSTGERRSGGSL